MTNSTSQKMTLGICKNFRNKADILKMSGNRATGISLKETNLLITFIL